MRLGIPVQIMATAGVLTLILTGLVVHEGQARANGQEVVLEITGADPRSLLTGHYVQFQIRSALTPGAACPPGSAPPGARPVNWLALRRQGDHHVAVGVAGSRTAALTLGETVVRGDLDCQAGPTTEASWVQMNLGLDRLHVDQTQAEAIQRVLQTGREQPGLAKAVVSVGSDGKARLKGLIVSGRRLDLTWF